MADKQTGCANSAAAAEFNPFCAEAVNDPITYQRAMRQAGAVHVYRGYKHPLYALTRHADIRALWSDPASGSAKHGQMPDFTEEPGLRNDPPEHTIFRNLINPWFSPASVAARSGVYTETAHRLLDRMLEGKAGGDLYAGFCASYPITVAGEMLGVDASRYEDFHRWSTEFSTGSNTADLPRMTAAQNNIFDYLRTVLAARRRQLSEAPDTVPDDLVRHLVSSTHPAGRPYTDDELLQLMMLLLLGGTDTTASLLGNCVHRLLQEPALWRALHADPGLAETAIEESLRFDPPVMATFRTTAKAINVAGVEIPAGCKVAAYYSCANRDPDIWDEPERFRLDRDLAKTKRHLSFGFGIHHCVGNQLTRLDARIALQALAQRLPHLRLAGEPGFASLPFMRGVNMLPVRWDEPTNAA